MSDISGNDTSDMAVAGIVTLFVLGWIIVANLVGMVLLLVIKPKGRNRFGKPGKPMNIGESLQACTTAYAAANGRASRSEFWWFFLICFLVGVVIAVLADVLNLPFLQYANYGLFLPSLTVAIRRLHDLNRTGWWVLLGVAILPVCLWVVYAQPGTKDDSEAASVF